MGENDSHSPHLMAQDEDLEGRKLALIESLNMTTFADQG